MSPGRSVSVSVSVCRSVLPSALSRDRCTEMKSAARARCRRHHSGAALPTTWYRDRGDRNGPRRHSSRLALTQTVAIIDCNCDCGRDG